MTASPPSPVIVGVIPARWGSTRFPGKSLALIAGKPLVQRVWERARMARSLSRVLVATDDRRIRDAVLSMGGEAAMTKSDHPSGTDRIAEAIRDMAADVIVNIQGDEPLIDPVLIDDLGGALAGDASWDMATAACPLTDAEEIGNPAVVKVVFNRMDQALYFSRSVIPHIRDAGSAPSGVLYWRHIGIYAYRRTYLERLVNTPVCALEQAEKLEQLRALDMGCRMKVLRVKAAGVGVDHPEDVAKVERLIEEAQG